MESNKPTKQLNIARGYETVSDWDSWHNFIKKSLKIWILLTGWCKFPLFLRFSLFLHSTLVCETCRVENTPQFCATMRIEMEKSCKSCPTLSHFPHFESAARKKKFCLSLCTFHFTGWRVCIFDFSRWVFFNFTLTPLLIEVKFSVVFLCSSAATPTLQQSAKQL